VLFRSNARKVFCVMLFFASYELFWHLLTCLCNLAFFLTYRPITLICGKAKITELFFLSCFYQIMLHKVSMVFRKKKSSSKPVNSYMSRGDHEYKNLSSAVTTDSCKQFVRAHGTSEVTSVAAADPPTCLSGTKSGELALCRHATGEIVQKWSGHDKEITKVACGGQNRELYVSASRDKTICVWRHRSDSSEYGLQYRYSGHDLSVTGVTLSPSGSHILSGSRDNTVRLWDVASGQCVQMMALAQNVVTHVCWSHCSDSPMAAQSSEDKTVRLWDTRSLRVAVTTAPKQYIQTCCDVSGVNDRLCLSASNGFGGNGCEASLWDLRTSARPLREFTGHFATVTGCCFVPLSSRFTAATCSNDGTVRLWDCDTGANLATVSIPASGPLTSISPNVDSMLFVSSFFAGIQVLTVRQNTAGTIDLQQTAAY